MYDFLFLILFLCFFVMTFYVKKCYVHKPKVLLIIKNILNSTIDRQSVRDAMIEIDKFDAKGLDKELQKKIFSILKRLEKTDQSNDAIHYNKWTQDV